MKRAPIVLAGTVAGLAGVLAYHPGSSGTSAAQTGAATTAAASTATASTSASNTSASGTSASGTATTASTARTTTSSAARSATGEDVQYRYGDLQVKVTVSGTKVTNVSLVSLNETDPHSQQIDAQAVPELEQQTLSAGSAHIDGVSGASFTSAAYEQSLQSALDKLGISS